MKKSKESNTAQKESNTAQIEVFIEPPRKWWNLRFTELWQYRELLYFFVWRDLKVRYKQTVLGVAWAILQPLMTMVVISIVFGRFANLPSDGLPYPVFTYVGLLPWQLFSRALTDASLSLVSNQHMVSKTYFPRLYLPASNIISGLVDFMIAFVVLLGLMFYYDIPLTWKILYLPLFLLAALLTAVAISMWLSVFNVKYRDVKYLLPFLVQFWFYATPVAYSSSLFPEQWRTVLGLNPMAGVVVGFRWALLDQGGKFDPLLWISGVVIIFLLVGGLMYFQYQEQTFADVI